MAYIQEQIFCGIFTTSFIMILLTREFCLDFIRKYISAWDMSRSDAANIPKSNGQFIVKCLHNVIFHMPSYCNVISFKL